MNTTSEPQVHFGLPPASLFQFPPSGVPDTLPAPHGEKTWLQPFPIPPAVFNSLLDVRVPLTVAALYATTVVLMNKVNKRRGNKPWAISKTKSFKTFVILHNVFLAIYSVWTCVGMVQALRNSFSRWDGNDYSLLNLADSMCKINGPRGFGNAASYDAQTGLWGYHNPDLHLGEGGVPDSTDVGRLWNQGLAFFGWIFYLSKFYEVLDTVIILAKGKRSSTLQTYHHAGAMMCMWAGMRYMASPIWIFALVNSGIHALMYTYYTLTSVSIRVPTTVKRTLTTMQITQFVIGTFMAASHLFISYDIPAMIPYEVVDERYASSLPSLSSIAGSVATVATAGLIPWVKKLALRAAGAEGIAENVVNDNGLLFGSDSLQVARAAKESQGTRYVQGYRTVNCMDNSGQAFAVWLNVMYLLPLTYLFGRFFVRSYLRRAESGPKDQPRSQVIEKSSMDALKGVSKEISDAILEMHGDGVSSRGTNTPDVSALETLAENAAAEAEKGFTRVPENKAAPATTTSATTTPSPKSKKKRKGKQNADQTAAQANPFDVLGGDDERGGDVSVQS